MTGGFDRRIYGAGGSCLALGIRVVLSREGGLDDCDEIESMVVDVDDG